MTDSDFGKTDIAVVNSFSPVCAVVHSRDPASWSPNRLKPGGVAKEFNTIAVDDGIAMGHGGMLYSLPSRELIADSVEYMVNAHALTRWCVSQLRQNHAPGCRRGLAAPEYKAILSRPMES